MYAILHVNLKLYVVWLQYLSMIYNKALFL